MGDETFTCYRFYLRKFVAVIVAFALDDDVVVALGRKRQIAILKYASPNQGGKFWCCSWGLETRSFSTHVSTCFHYHGIQLQKCESIRYQLRCPSHILGIRNRSRAVPVTSEGHSELMAHEDRSPP